MHQPRGDQHALERGQLDALEHAALDAEPRRARGVTSGIGSASSASPRRNRAATSPDPRQLAGDPGRDRRWAGGARTRAAPSGPDGVRGDELDHLGELDGLERVGALFRGQRRRGAALRRGPAPRGEIR